MGWAARAKQGKGNPEQPRLGVRFIDERNVRQQRRVGLTPVVDFGDRRYAIGPEGQLRRLPADAGQS